jgi:hypothetical protein
MTPTSCSKAGPTGDGFDLRGGCWGRMASFRLRFRGAMELKVESLELKVAGKSLAPWAGSVNGGRGKQDREKA